MKKNNRLSIAYFLALMFITTGSACRLPPAARTAGNTNVSIRESAGAEAANASILDDSKPDTVKTPTNINGEYLYKTKGRNHYENSLQIKSAGGSKINVSYEGVYIYQVGDSADDTMKEGSGEGVLTLKGNMATGTLTEEGSNGGCRVSLTFNGSKVTLKSDDCNLNVAPDGVYMKETAARKTDIDGDNGAPPPAKTKANKAVNDDTKPFVQYDSDGTPNAIINMMATAEDRVGCEEETKTSEGKVVRSRQTSPVGYELTLAKDGGKNQTFYVYVGENVSTEDAESIVTQGARLTVNYILCGNAGHPTPIEIYKK